MFGAPFFPLLWPLRIRALVPGLLILGDTGYIYWHIQSYITAHGNPDGVSPGIAFAFLIIGGLAMVISAFLFNRMEPPSEEDDGPIWSESREDFTIDLKGCDPKRKPRDSK